MKPHFVGQQYLCHPRDRSSVIPAAGGLRMSSRLTTSSGIPFCKRGSYYRPQSALSLFSFFLSAIIIPKSTILFALLLIDSTTHLLNDSLIRVSISLNFLI